MSAHYRKSVVGLIDILGVSARLALPDQARRYSNAVAAILKPMIGDKGEWCFRLPHVDEPRRIEIFLSPSFVRGSKLSFMSDSIVISTPLDTPGQSAGASILACLEAVQALQRSLLMLGLRSRGGIALGGVIHSGELIVGEGLVRAHDLERKAIFPRTVIHQEAIEELLRDPTEQFPVYRNRLSHALRQDEDGAFFVDYLGYSPVDGYCGLDREFDHIIRSLERDIATFEDDRVVEKLRWLLRYAGRSHDEQNSGKVRPRAHVTPKYGGVFLRTDRTLPSYVRSEEALVAVLRSHPIPAGIKVSIPMWPLGWETPLDPARKRILNEELQREIAKGHLLHGEDVFALGQYGYSDDCLFAFANGKVAEVHLTWNRETTPDWPVAKVFPSYYAWVAHWNARVARRN
jgi:hypothetical protein